MNSLEIKSLSTRVFHKWLSPALAEWVAILALFLIGFEFNSFPVWAVVTILLGSRQHALGVLGHDSAHYTASGNRFINDLSAELLCFWPLFTGLADFRRFHLHHHRYFNTSRDPELLFRDKWSKRQWTPPISRRRILFYFLGDLIGLGIVEVIKAHWLLGKQSIRSWIGPLLWWAAAGGTLLWLHLGFVIVIWCIALSTSFWGFFRLRTWTEHVGTSSTHRVGVNWWQRILITPHCSWSHYEHHNFPSVPFWSRSVLRGPDAPTMGLWELLGSFDRPPDSELEAPSFPPNQADHTNMPTEQTRASDLVEAKSTL